MNIPDEVRARFDVDWDGPARAVYEFMAGTRRIVATKQMLAEALRTNMTRAPTPDTPRPVVPGALHHAVRRTEVHLAGDGAAPTVRALVYHPRGAESPPVLLFIHGGGWCTGEPEGTDLIARKLCWLAGVVVVSIAYRLAPEHPFSAGLDDCVAAYRWLRERARPALGADPDRIAVSGDSAGGNLAAALTLRVRDAGWRRPEATLLLCPVTDLLFEEHASCRRLAPNGLVYDAAFLGYVRSAYAAYDVWQHPYVSPLRADLHGFGPACVVAGSADPLVDDNRAFAERLRAAGNEAVELHVAEGMPHAFYYALGLAAAEEQAYQVMAAFLRRTLNVSPAPGP